VDRHLSTDDVRISRQPDYIGSVWEEFLVPDTAKVIAWFDDPYWHFPAIVRNQYGSGTLTYESTFLSDTLQEALIRDLLKRLGMTGPDQTLPPAVKIRHGRNREGKLLHYYLNFSGAEQTVPYPYTDGTDLLTGNAVKHGKNLQIGPWDLVIVSEP